ncbi:hypothetical protein Fsol_00064 [Candidatus Fokinia solitaria]|uniref:Porin n=1 Tax=Candidatus Fokinia solitaria TaxID=1802984 RepID=A0A2U8BRB3_9RICK|nr:hypothetical protein [Candidatus Fokinia solitaria]AWD32877.1 hypothetical protein Fsol_00064 [Candidatus Fokinia solitaria]
MYKYIGALYAFYLFCTSTSYSNAYSNNEENTTKGVFSSKMGFEMWNTLSEQSGNDVTYGNNLILTGELKYKKRISDYLKYIIGVEGAIYTSWSEVMNGMPILQNVYGILKHDITPGTYQKLVLSMKTDKSINPLEYQLIGFRTHTMRYIPIALLQQSLSTDDADTKNIANIKPYSSFLGEQPLYENNQLFANKVSLVGCYNDFTVGVTYVPNTSEYLGKTSILPHTASITPQQYRDNIRAIVSYCGKFKNVDFATWCGGENAYLERSNNRCSSMIYGMKIGYMGAQLSLAGALFDNIAESLKGDESSMYLGASYGISRFRIGFMSDTFFGEEHVSNQIGLFEVHYNKHIAILFGISKTQYKGKDTQNLVMCNIAGTF